jgi:hypothetical protein
MSTAGSRSDEPYHASLENGYLTTKVTKHAKVEKEKT